MRLDVAKLRDTMRDRRVTQTELARRSGVSRATIARLLGRVPAEVHTGTAQKLAAALGLSPAFLDKEGIQAAYLQHVADEHERLDFTGMGVIGTAEPMPMDRGYIPVHVRRWREEDSCIGRRDRAGTAPDIPRARTRPMSLGTALFGAGRVFLLGDPGSGKTTALSHLARAYAKDRQKEHSYPPESLIPVYVRLADWAEQLREAPQTGLLDGALAQSGLANPQETREWLEQQAKDGNALLLLDGLDEVADADGRALVIDAIRSFVADHRDARVVISSRIVGFDAPNLGARFDRLVVEPLGEPAIAGFARNWCTFRHGHDAERSCADCRAAQERLRRAVMEHPRIRGLAGNPMMLTILALLWEAGAALPQRRCELYQKVSEAFLFTWERRKRSDLPGTPDRASQVDDREVLWILESVAYQMQRHDWTLVPRWWLLEHVGAFLRDELGLPPDAARAEADTLVRSLAARSGIILERGPGKLAFWHLAFQEYFASRAVLALPDPVESLRAYCYHPRWREVVRLTAAQIDRRHTPRLLRAILDDPDPAGRFLRRGLLAALACLADGAFVKDAKLLDDIKEGVVDLGRSRWFGLGMNAMGSLAEMRGTRLETFAIQTVEGMLAAARDAFGANEAFPLLFGAAVNGFLPGLPGEAAAGEGESPDETFEHPVSVENITLGEVKLRLLMVKHPGRDVVAWREAVVGQLRSDASPQAREACAGELRRYARRERVKRVLWEAFGSETDPRVREAIADALGPAVDMTETREGLLQTMESDPAPAVRAACARALGRAVGHRPDVRQKLLSVALSQEPPAVRAGAIRGLSRCVAACDEAREALLGILRNDQEPDEVRTACLRSLEDVLHALPSDLAFVESLLGGPPEANLTRASAQLLASYAASGRARWEDLPIEAIEQALMSLKAPCQHSLDALRALVDARELRGRGIPREARIRRALADVADRIAVAFIFGSSARGQQDADSDVDLMVIGEVSLRELAGGLRQAEQELGRQVNAVIYSQAEWVRRRREKDAFVTNVLRDGKDFVLGDAHDLTAMEG